jgi:hypothetical protein
MIALYTNIKKKRGQSVLLGLYKRNCFCQLCLIPNVMSDPKRYLCVYVFLHICTIHITYLLTYLLTDPMELGAWEANRFSSSQEIPRILWKPEIRYSVYKRPSHILVRSQINPVHGLHPTFCWSILILSSHIRLVIRNGIFSWGFHTNPCMHLLSPFVLHAQAHHILNIHPNNIWWRVQISKHLIM